MVFSSIIFIFGFLPIVLLLYYVCNKEYRNIYLAIVSFLFYSFGGPKYLIIMCISILINYSLSLLINYITNVKEELKRNRRLVLFLIVFLNLLLLFYFKYFDFTLHTINGIFNTSIPIKNIILPIGISFYTFQGLSYSLDVYMGKIKVQKNIINLAINFSFFPHLIAGPIVRFKDVNDQIYHRECTSDKFVEGIHRFIIGLAKKVIIADNMAYVTDQIFGLEPSNLTAPIAWLGIICYTLQIYFDFSGYSDMAIGLGKMFGFEFLENFNYPYISKSITEFWRRWHISLSSWFRDYLYIPLGGNRKGNVYFNLIVVFFVTGLWHGASWNFIVWGLYYGVFLIFERIFKQFNINIKIPAPIKWFYTIIVVIIGWVFFRSPDLTYAIGYLKVMFGLGQATLSNINILWYMQPEYLFIFLLGVIFSFPIKNKLLSFDFIKNKKTRFVIYNFSLFCLFIIAIVYVMSSTYSPFIYFRF
ncbi:MBOAT family protein [Paenibacillus sp. WQ 127069]|uniref:MBOAT family protein n=1 Tax=Paenibacillus baimaensis TaxID=2982185 RepID=A0ABT2USR0_9BACL|nr:MBOAT family O-acyltransferase [Paenibacillus sp. WQ 127069]MCU6797655.1 MBOAT family protein [Paenibacillus sp. WQ 127069]